MRLVLDASAAIEVVLRRPKARRFAQPLEEADEVLAPDLFVPEVVNTVWKYHNFEALGLGLCDEAIAHALELVDAFTPCRELHREAFLLARTTRRPAYDMFYLALARREDALLATADAALQREAERQSIRVV
jgi:predicted nucleic acid-binding protein